MVKIYDICDDNFANDFNDFLKNPRGQNSNVDAVVAEIIANIEKRGDSALIAYTEKFDNMCLDASELRLSDNEIHDIIAQTSDEDIFALEKAHQRIKNFHQKYIPDGGDWVDDDGVRLGARWSPIDAVGIYVPGGTASYPSSVLMNAIPAKVAGVQRIAMMVPTPNHSINPLVIAAAKMAGVDEIYRIGGAQAVAALSHGTETIKAVDKIVGPGNAYVASAKKQVFGKVGIDMIAGPSEILLVSDNKTPPEWVAMDLLSQAEHDIWAQSLLITDDKNYAHAVIKAADEILKTLPRRDIAGASFHESAIFIVQDIMKQAGDIINKIAPEHLQLAIEQPDALMQQVKHAGAIFLGRYTPEAIGDYIAGPNHVLPTNQTARFSSGLSVLDFLKRTTFVECDATSLQKVGPAAAHLAIGENLHAHAYSIQNRLEKLDKIVDQGKNHD